jgi:DNA endonuclease I-HmuI-like, NUMOD-like domain
MSNRNIAVSQYNGKKLVAKYRSITEAAEMTGVQPAHIGKVANGIRNTAGGFSWKSTKTFSPKMKNGVTQSDSTGAIAVYADLDLASSFSGVTRKSIDKVLSGKGKMAGGYLWSA